MEPTAGEESDRKTVDDTDDTDDTDEVPIVVPDERDEQAISESPVGRHVVAARERSTLHAVPEQDDEVAEQDEEEVASDELAPEESEEPEERVEPEDDLDQAVTVHSDERGDHWGGLTPLGSDDLAAMDPSMLEDDLVDDAEIVDYVEPTDVSPASKRRAEDLTSDTVLRVHARPPQAGWRRFVYELTGGLIHPRLSRSDRARAEQLGLIRTLVTQPRRITVVSRKGGVGKTTTTLMLGQTLASERGDRIVAVDGNPDAGSLGYRVGPQPVNATITDLLSELDSVHRYADMRRYTAQTTAGLEVLMADDDPQITTALGDEEYGAVMSLLDRFYNLVLIDTGTGILDSAVQGILDGTDQIVLVVAPSLDAARAASQTLDWLNEHGFVDLVESAVTVINQARRTAYVDIARIEEHFWDRCGATVRIPWDRYLEAGAETDLDDLRPATREAYIHLAAAVASRFET